MYGIVRQHCISDGPAKYLEIIKADEASECIIEIEAEKLPSGNILTRGMNPALVLAHDLPYSRNSVYWRIRPVDEFSVLYMTLGRELFSIKYKDKKAVLDILNADRARELYQELPQKLLPVDYLFNTKVYMGQMERDRVNVHRKKKTEKEKEGKLEEYKENSALYVKSGSSLGAG